MEVHAHTHLPRPYGHNSDTYEQIKASGSLRYFRQELTDLLNQYDVQAKKAKVREEIHMNYATNRLNPFLPEVLDNRVARYRTAAFPGIHWFFGKPTWKRSLSGSIMLRLSRAPRKEH